MAYTYASAPDLLENYAQLKAHGIIPYWCVHPGTPVSIYYADPDENQARTSRLIRSVLSTTRTSEINKVTESIPCSIGPGLAHYWSALLEN